MYIKDAEIIYDKNGGYGYGPEVKLSIKNCTTDDLKHIKMLVDDASSIKVISTEALRILKRTANSTYGLPEATIPLAYSANDCAVSYGALHNTLFKRSNSTDGLKVTKVIYHNPATIVFWSDGTKTVVKCGKGDTYDKEKGFFIACAKKLFGNDYKAVGRMNKALEMAVVQKVLP